VAGFESVVTLEDEAATAALGARIASALQPGDAVLISGELGAGKTTLVRGILHALGVEGHVPSPTFTLVQTYETKDLPVAHYDLYRIESRREIAELGLEDSLNAGAALIEWPERGVPERLAVDALYIALIPTGEKSREARMGGPSRWQAALRA
jgi:tRNA threonylcarbamoyladenosine biosynthesis protein TsaE